MNFLTRYILVYTRTVIYMSGTVYDSISRHMTPHNDSILHFCQSTYQHILAERLRRAYPAPLGRAGVGSIPANPDAQNVPSIRRWRFEMKFSPFTGTYWYILVHLSTHVFSCFVPCSTRRARLKAADLIQPKDIRYKPQQVYSFTPFCGFCGRRQNRLSRVAKGGVGGEVRVGVVAAAAAKLWPRT
jgi:hypothetical protein